MVLASTSAIPTTSRIVIRRLTNFAIASLVSFIAESRNVARALRVNRPPWRRSDRFNLAAPGCIDWWTKLPPMSSAANTTPRTARRASTGQQGAGRLSAGHPSAKLPVAFCAPFSAIVRLVSDSKTRNAGITVLAAPAARSLGNLRSAHDAPIGPLRSRAAPSPRVIGGRHAVRPGQDRARGAGPADRAARPRAHSYGGLLSAYAIPGAAKRPTSSRRSLRSNASAGS